VDYFLSVTDSGWRAGAVAETEQSRRDLLNSFKAALGSDRVRHAKISRKFHSDLSHHMKIGQIVSTWLQLRRRCRDGGMHGCSAGGPITGQCHLFPT